ncbi:MAG TPA: TSUP family transporter [Pyrinomonadaceae bacterium]|nr:TSUP family transporter [Pyrinomonadaceae bacterium]
MDLHTVVAIILSGAIGISLGLLGGGGAILAVPVLVYVAGIEPKESVAMSLAIIGSTSLVGGLLHGSKGKVELKVAAIFGGAGITGAYTGARLTHLVANSTLLLLFAALNLIVATAMLLRKDKPDASATRTQKGSLALRLLVGLGVGVLTGFLGVGGGFLVVPALVLFARLPMRLAARFTPRVRASAVTNLDVVRDLSWTATNLTSPNAVLIDARPVDEYTGTKPGDGVPRGGHIPGAANVF